MEAIRTISLIVCSYLQLLTHFNYLLILMGCNKAVIFLWQNFFSFMSRWLVLSIIRWDLHQALYSFNLIFQPLHYEWLEVQRELPWRVHSDSGPLAHYLYIISHEHWSNTLTISRKKLNLIIFGYFARGLCESIGKLRPKKGYTFIYLLGILSKRLIFTFSFHLQVLLLVPILM